MPSTTPYEARRQSPESERGKSARSTKPYGDRRDFPGVAASTSRRGAAAGACGAALKFFTLFYVKRWITDLEVDSRLSELLVFSAMLGLAVALGDDFVKWSYSVQCLVRHWIHGAGSLRGHSTGAALGQGCHTLVQRCIIVEVPQLQFLFKVVNIPVGAQRQLPMVSVFRDH